MVQVMHYSLCRILYIRNKIEVDGVFVSYNLFYISHSFMWSTTKYVCNFQCPNTKTKACFIDVSCDVYSRNMPILLTCDFSHNLIFWLKLLHHIMHHKPI
jgi:hypothetical protein